jgi:hypothetical protein
VKAPPELKAYVRVICALLRPNKVPPPLNTYRNVAGDIGEWTREELTILIEEGRRELDGQSTGLLRIRDQARLVFTIAVALTVVMGVELRAVAARAGGWRWPLIAGWTVGTALTFLALVGAAAIATVAAHMGLIDTAVLSHYRDNVPAGSPSADECPVHRRLAKDYASMMKDGADSVNTLQTVFRYGVLNLCIGGLVQLVVWALLLLSRTALPHRP